MGSGQSTRKVTILNEEEGDVIKVSNSLVHRLVRDGKNSTPEAAKDVRAPTQQSTATSASPAKVIAPSPYIGDSPAGHPVQYHPEYTLSALQMQQQKEVELLNQEQYWQRRLQMLENSHEKINRIIEEEYKKAINEFSPDKTGPKRNIENTTQPCLENTEKVLKCYQEYPKETLKCASLVEEFSSCVDQCRARVIAARC